METIIEEKDTSAPIYSEIYDKSLADYEDDGTRRPYRYQQKGIEFGLERDAFALFWEMRLGKTITIIKTFKQKGCKKILVICPKSVINTWIRELKLENIDALQIDTVLARNEILNTVIKAMPGWYITNYETLIREDISDMSWDGIILDEAEKIKDPSTQISKVLAGHFDQTDGETLDKYRYIPNRAILTGTPAPETLLNYFQQLKFLHGEFAGTSSFWKFKNSFFRHVGNNKYTPYLGIKEVLSKHLAENCFVLQRDQVGIGSKKIYEVRDTDLSPEMRKLYDEFESTWMTKEFQVQFAIAAYSHLRQMSGGFHKNMQLESHHKLDELKGILKNDLKGERVIIWCAFRKEIKAIINALPKDSAEAFTGDTSIAKKKYLEDIFAYRNRKKDNKIKYLVCQTKTGCRGVDFAGADQAIYFSNELGCLYRHQSEDRIIHPEKEVPLLYIDIAANNTICPDILDALKSKIENQQGFLMLLHDKMRERFGA